MKLDTFTQEIEDMWSRVAVLQNKTETQKMQPQQLEIFAQVFEELSKTTEELYVAHEQLKELTLLLEEQNQLLNTAYQEAEVQRQKVEAERQHYQQLLEQDLHQGRLKEKSLKKLTSRIVSITSHEFRTPLTIILSSAEMLEYYRHKWSDSKQLTHIHRIQNAANQMNQLFNNILTLSNIEANKLEFKPVSLDLVQFCSDLVEELLFGDNNQHTIAFNTDSQCILGNFDPQLLRHILYNLLSDALKYSPICSTIEFTLSSFQSKAAFEISDFGIGIPSKDLPYIFEPFYRASNATNISGSGLGMTIVKEAVNLHGGEIHVRSSIEGGTTFSVTLPL
ncbi:HAMP domain-containing histidine kinase [Aetokthonos hydrillicola Thurmond2011]|jgi:signal transduction histidine kinase|uniref:histidine kinase n=1 Tax=Aetokthonos hydrillicola Thurmond2011 TaxID=2712845 RepID=A0AAP5IF66_9CYAN|nr:HAMP domain-containing sensor histidine kinase [Aetokthonos hydrillicola]MBO3459682.1 HAMP domain-containing histidine kinase [Aetokthonos hydrillicola CCALA 1050]MBW4589046.1 HAMP domain-containing histidine kinase [Aetokthonos hydrillicola CCALA 1050]MDR9900119.1 HAMP domain-containing histidine kinase [Aetokthonos hydrillicola Thurmond2011]